MKATLTDGETIFILGHLPADGERVLGPMALTMNQQTPTTTRLRADFLTGFKSRGTRAFSFNLSVTMPPCASLEDAAIELFQHPINCPKGGILDLEEGSQRVRFATAWLQGDIIATSMGLTNLFTFPFQANEPDVTTLSPLAQMDSRFVLNLPAITGLTGGTSSKLDSLVTTDVDTGTIIFVLITLSSIVTPKHFQLVAGADAEQADPDAGLIVIRPEDYHGTTNAKVWKERS